MKKFTLLFAVFTYLLSVQPVFAELKIGDIYAFGDIKSLGQGLDHLTNPAFTIATAAVVIYFLIGGVRLLLSGGDKTAIDGARRMITHAIIGFVILLFAYLILQFIPQFFGVRLFLI